mgnify:CR=1 FL=1
MAFHHGTETKKTDGGSSPIYTIDGAITALVGTAYSGPVNELTVCKTQKDFAQFGAASGNGFTIADAAEILALYQAGTYYVVNVLDPAKHKKDVSDETVTPTEDKQFAVKPGVVAGSLVLQSDSAPLTLDKDYTFDPETGKGTLSAAKENLTASYSYLDPAAVTEEEVIGAYVAATNKRTGLQAVKDGFTLYGADAKVIIVPEYDKTASMAAQMWALADSMDAEAYVQAPKGTGLSKAVQGRGAAGSINFYTSSKAANLLYPHVKRGDKLDSLAVHAAGLRMKVDVEEGFWISHSNHELMGVTGLEVPLTARADDINSETNQLNAVGITTVFNSYGTGYRLWGNRNASWPTNSHISNFAVSYRSGNFHDEAIRRAQLKYVDRPVDQALLDTFLEDVRTYFSGSQAVVGFDVQHDFDYDLANAYSQGQVPLKYEWTPKLPAERVSNNSVMTRKYLANLVSSNS